MAIFIIKCFIATYTVLIIMQTSCATVPKNCSKYLSNSVSCYPHIPSFLPIYGWNLSGVITFILNSYSSYMWTLQTLPDDIFEMASGINNLFLDNTGLEKLPCDVFKPFQKSLVSISLDDNLFEEFPVCALKHFKALKIVRIENQQLKYFQGDMISWNSIHTIYLRNNELTILNVSNIDNQNEVSIYLDNNKITILHMFDMNYIKLLSAKNNLIGQLNSNIFQNSTTTLAYLDLSNNILDNSIWDVLKDVSSLQSIKLNSNQISVASSSILNSAYNLEYLDLSNNKLTSLSGVALRSGKLQYLFLGSNKLTEIPPFLTSSAYTFDNSPQQYDLSNNSIVKLHISIPSDAPYLKVRLDRNKLREITFDSNEIQIRTLNISHNDIHVLPYLPKAHTYVLSYNPLNTADVIQTLTNEMLGASAIELEHVGLFFGEDSTILPSINVTGLSLLNLRHNCIPLDIICHINTSFLTCLSLYLDHNKAKQLSCSLRDKGFNVFSVNECDLDNTVITRIFGDDKPTYFRKISAQQNDATFIPFLRNTLVQNSDYSCDLSMNRIKELEGFNISAYRVNLNLKDNEISSVKQGKIWSTYPYLYLTLSFANNSLVEINDGVVSIYSLNDNLFHTLISIDVSYNSIQEIKFKHFIQFKTTRVIAYPYLNINLSHNNIQSIEDCIPLDMFLTLDLSFNDITILPNMSCGLAYKMYLGYNQIRGIKTLIPSAGTKVLDLQWNRITEIHLHAFDNLTYLTELNLRGNRIDSFPSSIKALRSLKILDISFNRIKHVSQTDFNDLNSLQKLTITDNSFFIPVNDLQLSKLYHFEENEIHCDCNMIFLRNQSFSPRFIVTGRCTTPSEYEGYHVSCFPVNQCIGVVPLYITKTTIETCQNDKYYDTSINTTETGDTLIIHMKMIGQRKPRSMGMKAFSKRKLIKEVRLNITDRIISFWLDRYLVPDNFCFSSVFHDNESVTRCFAVNIQSKYKSDEKEENNGILYGISSMLAISLLVNISIGLFTLLTYRNKHKKADKQYSKNNNNPERYEIPSASSVGSSLQSVYEDIPGLERNDREHSYSNLALDM